MSSRDSFTEFDLITAAQRLVTACNENPETPCRAVENLVNNLARIARSREKVALHKREGAKTRMRKLRSRQERKKEKADATAPVQFTGPYKSGDSFLEQINRLYSSNT